MTRMRFFVVAPVFAWTVTFAGDEEAPDVVYSIYLSYGFLPKILQIAKQEFSLPVVYRLSDFHMFCPSYLFYRDGEVCTECNGSLFAAFKHKCVHHSGLMSLLRIAQIL